MSELIDQADFDGLADSGGAAAATAPLDSILSGESGAADVPASSPEREASQDYEHAQVPLVALKRERERRKQMDARVQELEREIERFNNQKWGFEDEEEASEQAYARQAPDPAIQQNLDRSMGGFSAKHGEGRLSAVEAAVVRLNPAQQAEARALALQSKDPVEAIHAYVQKVGLLDSGFKRASITDLLSGKRQEPAADTSKLDQRLEQLSQREQSLALAERRAVGAASKTEFLADHGPQTFAALDAAVGALVQSGNEAAVQQLVAAAQASPHPYLTAAHLMTEWGLMVGQAQPAPRPVFPSNLAGARNVGPRRGPEWSGSTPLKDIFDRRQPGAA